MIFSYKNKNQFTMIGLVKDCSISNPNSKNHLTKINIPKNTSESIFSTKRWTLFCWEVIMNFIDLEET